MLLQESVPGDLGHPRAPDRVYPAGLRTHFAGDYLDEWRSQHDVPNPDTAGGRHSDAQGDALSGDGPGFEDTEGNHYEGVERGQFVVHEQYLLCGTGAGCGAEDVILGGGVLVGECLTDV